MSEYRYQPTERFQSRLSKIRTVDPSGFERIERVIARLLENPADSDGQMHGPHRGKLKKYAGRDEYRLIYHYCAVCRKANRRQLDHCFDCETIPDNSVIFFDVYHKNEKDKLGY